MTEREKQIVWAVLEAKARDAEAGDFDDAMTEANFHVRGPALLKRNASARELRKVADMFKP